MRIVPRLSVCSPSDRKERRGACLVEFAFVFPVFIAVVLGILEFGRAMMVGQMITNAAREGSRQAILDGATNAKVEQFINEFLENALNIDADDITITITVTPAEGNPPASTIETAQTKDLISIQIQVPYVEVSYFAPHYLTDAQLRARAAMRKE